MARLQDRHLIDAPCAYSIPGQCVPTCVPKCGPKVPIQPRLQSTFCNKEIHPPFYLCFLFFFLPGVYSQVFDQKQVRTRLPASRWPHRCTTHTAPCTRRLLQKRRRLQGRSKSLNVLVFVHCSSPFGCLLSLRLCIASPLPVSVLCTPLSEPQACYGTVPPSCAVQPPFCAANHTRFPHETVYGTTLTCCGATTPHMLVTWGASCLPMCCIGQVHRPSCVSLSPSKPLKAVGRVLPNK